VLPIIHVEAFYRVCRVLNKVDQVKQTDWDLHVPVVQWAYRTMCKTLNTEIIPKVQNGVLTKLTEEDPKMNPHVLPPAVAAVRGCKKEEITHLREDEHLRIQEAIQ